MSWSPVPLPEPRLPGWQPDGYVELVVGTALTASRAQLAATVTHTGLLLSCCGFEAASDQVIDTWWRATGGQVGELHTDAVSTRALTVQLANRTDRPGWARELPPPDLDAVERDHQRYLARERADVAEGAEGAVADGDRDERAGDDVAGALAGLARDIAAAEGGITPADPLRAAAREADEAARGGDGAATDAALRRWCELARQRTWPPVAMLGACRSLAPMLRDGALAGSLGVDHDWAQRCAGELQAAIRQRYPRDEIDRSGGRGMRELLEEILAMRGHPDLPAAPLPAPAPPAAVSAAERRLRLQLPPDYREFLLTSDGLPADVAFPRMLGAAELRPRAERGVVPVSEPAPLTAALVLLVDITLAAGGTGARDVPAEIRRVASGASGWRAIEYDPELGSTVYASFRELLEGHLHLLRRSRG
ncbi:hypothetical protein [Haloechinothrix sp. LS1_15]|uniref:hypothetical protein n=1 Tax=Haloechinothrix sp. LS1_15 TaxID=2652248 RepID=UPI0029456054|nr:hypothetical protein [Haloechinothrix sp. LS1_15]MDV6012726.1 SMI1/KNR4 family protein [Haloechinothrix sp. LS1_15]